MKWNAVLKALYRNEVARGDYKRLWVGMRYYNMRESDAMGPEWIADPDASAIPYNEGQHLLQGNLFHPRTEDEI